MDVVDHTADVARGDRFYGLALALYGVLFFVGARVLQCYRPVLRCALWVFFAAGLARLVSIAVHGLPPILVLALMASELVAPPLILVRLSPARARTAEHER